MTTFKRKLRNFLLKTSISTLVLSGSLSIHTNLSFVIVPSANAQDAKALQGAIEKDFANHTTTYLLAEIPDPNHADHILRETNGRTGSIDCTRPRENDKSDKGGGRLSLEEKPIDFNNFTDCNTLHTALISKVQTSVTVGPVLNRENGEVTLRVLREEPAN